MGAMMGDNIKDDKEEGEISRRISRDIHASSSMGHETKGTCDEK